MGWKHYFFKTIFKSLIFQKNNRSCTRHAQSHWGVIFAAIAVSIKLSSILSFADPASAEDFWKRDSTDSNRSFSVLPAPPSPEKSKEASRTTAQERKISSHDPIADRQNKLPKMMIMAGETAKTPLNQARKKAKEIQEQLEKAESDVKSTSAAEAKLLSQLNQTERMLNRTRKELASSQRKYDEILMNINAHQTALKNLEETISLQEAYISKRLIALYKLSWLGQLPILASADTGIDFFKRKANLEFILNQDHTAFTLLQNEKKKHGDMLTQLDDQKTEQKSVETQLKHQNEALSIQRVKKVQLIDQIQQRKDLQLAVIHDLKLAAEKLDQTFASLSAQTQGAEADLSDSEREFYKLKGLLKLPVKGKIIHFYGRFKNKKLNVDNFRTGITIQADRGEPIRSVGSGNTIFADWFRGYGNMIIIDHGNHYYTVYAHLEEIFKSTGDRVEADEVIATVGDTGSMSGTGLHFEVRHHGKPLDPMNWIRKG